jgi:hypothetical protein
VKSAEPCDLALRQFQRTFLFALVLFVCLVSIPNIYFAFGTSHYPDFWQATLGHKPMSMWAEAICRASVPYSATAILIPCAAVCSAFMPLTFPAATRFAIAGIALASLQLLSSLYFLWHEWWITVINGRLLMGLFL